MKRLIVTIDGPAGAGKSTIAHRLANTLGLDFLDTGAMYRGLAAMTIERNLDVSHHASAIERLAHEVTMDFDWSVSPPALIVSGENYSGRIRDAAVTARASEIAQLPGVRRAMVVQQRRIATEHPKLVTEGRDQGSVVFPDATVKFYLNASPEERARRRAEQWRGEGKTVDEDEILRDIIERDERDTTRAEGPLVKPADAVVIDSTGMEIDEVVSKMTLCVKEAVAGQDSTEGEFPEIGIYSIIFRGCYGVLTTTFAVILSVCLWALIFDSTGGEPLSRTVFGVMALTPVFIVIMFVGTWWSCYSALIRVMLGVLDIILFVAFIALK